MPTDMKLRLPSTKTKKHEKFLAEQKVLDLY